MHFDVIIVGGGPAGLACATTLAEYGKSVLVLERKDSFGPKVCAGGITWTGLISKVPETLIENSFPRQYIRTRFQDSYLEEQQPIIATVNREKLGSHMASMAVSAGASLEPSCLVTTIDQDKVTYINTCTGAVHVARFETLVGADGATSAVRQYLGLGVEKYGVGLNYQVEGVSPKMEWHLDWNLFRNGYGWIFPHKNTTSIGAYADPAYIPPAQLKRGMLEWANRHGYALDDVKPQAEKVNYDFRGWNFGKIFLIGEAAGLASGLTGEGIYPAIISGELVAHYICNRRYNMNKMERLIRMHSIHTRMVSATGRNRYLTSFLFEVITLCLRSGVLSFKKLEMAH